MCDTYWYDHRLTLDTNVLQYDAECRATNRQLGHCVVRRDGRWNIPGLLFRRTPVGWHPDDGVPEREGEHP